MHASSLDIGGVLEIVFNENYFVCICILMHLMQVKGHHLKKKKKGWAKIFIGSRFCFFLHKLFS